MNNIRSCHNDLDSTQDHSTGRRKVSKKRKNVEGPGSKKREGNFVSERGNNKAQRIARQGNSIQVKEPHSRKLSKLLRKNESVPLLKSGKAPMNGYYSPLAKDKTESE